MKKSLVKEIVAANIEAMKSRLGLDHWEIDVVYVNRIKFFGDDKISGSCTTDMKFVDKATIKLVPKKIVDEADVLSVLRHELVHCITSSFDFTLAITAQFVTKRECLAIQVIHCRANEDVTTHICKLLDSLKTKPASLPAEDS